MIQFSPITLADRELIESYTLASDIRNCDLSFANMYCWQPIYRSAWAEVEGFLVIRFYIDGTQKIGYMQPIGRDGGLDFSSIIPQMARDAHSHGDRLRIIGLTEEGRASLHRFYGDDFALHSDPCFEDYIYRRESLLKLSGKRLQPKRNHINQFRKLYPNFEYRAIGSEEFESCLALDKRWRTAQGEDDDNNSAERQAMERAFSHFEELRLRGGALYVGGEMVAFTYGSHINGDTFCVNVEKGDTKYTGCYTAINQIFVESLPDTYTYINREEDLGIEGLRRAKLSYYPDHRQVKYTAIYLHHDERECRELWREVFGDEVHFIDEFVMHHYSSRRMLRVTTSDNHYISMLHIIPFDSEVGRVAYIYGVATHPAHRGAGYASKLMTMAMELILREGYQCVMLIPSEEWLHGFYGRFGFEAGCHITFEAYNSFDFGSGDSSLDCGLIHYLGNNIELPDSLILTAPKG